MLASIVHTVDPFLIRFTDSIGVRWYGVAYATGFLLGWLVLRWMATTRRTPLTATQIGDVMTALIIGVLAGGRLGHIIFYEPKLFVTFHSAVPFWGVLDLHKGGMSSHGGMIGVTLACIWSARRCKVPILHIGDLVCLVAPIGLGLGRYANWINGELWGKPLPPEMQAAPPWWSVKFPAEVLEPGFWSTDLAAKTQALAPFRAPDLQLADAVYLACYAHNQKAIAALEPFLTARYPVNFLQALTDGVLLLLIVVVASLRPHRSGFVFGAFFIAYGVLRVLTEQIRIPDPDILTIGPVTLPMLLSGSMVLIGAAALWRAVAGSGQRFDGLLVRLPPDASPSASQPKS